MYNYCGPATLTFSEGEVEVGIVDIAYVGTGGPGSGHGFFRTSRAEMLQARQGNPILKYRSFAIRVSLKGARKDGVTIDTDGQPL